MIRKSSRTIAKKNGDIKSASKNSRLVSAVNESNISSINNVQNKLRTLATSDRNDREQSTVNWDETNKNDKNRTNELIKLTKQYGYIDSDKFGKQTEEDAWLIAQHAIHNISFMKKYLKLMEQRINENKSVTENYPLLVDRVAMLQNKKQTYGTQFIQNDNGKYVPHPIKDIKNIDKYRKKFNMLPFADDLAYFSAQ